MLRLKLALSRSYIWSHLQAVLFNQPSQSLGSHAALTFCMWRNWSAKSLTNLGLEPRVFNSRTMSCLSSHPVLGWVWSLGGMGVGREENKWIQRKGWEQGVSSCRMPLWETHSKIRLGSKKSSQTSPFNPTWYQPQPRGYVWKDVDRPLYRKHILPRLPAALLLRNRRDIDALGKGPQKGS